MITDLTLWGTFSTIDGIGFQTQMHTHEQIASISYQDFCTCIKKWLHYQLQHGSLWRRLPYWYHILLNEALPYKEQGISPWKGQIKRCFQSSFWLLLQRRGIFWNPLRLSMHKIELIFTLHTKYILLKWLWMLWNIVWNVKQMTRLGIMQLNCNTKRSLRQPFSKFLHLSPFINNKLQLNHCFDSIFKSCH